MKTRRVHWILQLLSAGQLVALSLAGWLVVDALLSTGPPQLSQLAGAELSPPLSAGSQAPPDLADFAPLWERDLSAQLIEKSPPPRPVTQPAPPPDPVLLPQLLATFIESERRWGLFLTVEGQARLRPPGQQVSGFAIIAIERGSARLRRGEHEYRIRIPERQATTPRRLPRRG